MNIRDLVRAAQEYDFQNHPRNQSWTRVHDSQVARLIRGAIIAVKENNPRQVHLTDEDV